MQCTHRPARSGDPQRSPGGWLKRETNTPTRRIEREKAEEMEVMPTGVSGGQLASVHLGPLCLFSPVPEVTKTPSLSSYPSVRVLRPFSALPPQYVPPDQLALTAAFAIPWYARISALRLRKAQSPWSHVAIEGKEGSRTSVVTRTEGEAWSALWTCSKDVFTAPDAQGPARLTETRGGRPVARNAGEKAKETRGGGERGVKERKHSTIVFHLAACVLGWETDEKINSARPRRLTKAPAGRGGRGGRRHKQTLHPACQR